MKKTEIKTTENVIDMKIIIDQIGKLANALYEEQTQYETAQEFLSVDSDYFNNLQEKCFMIAELHQLLSTQDEDSMDTLNMIIENHEERVTDNKRIIVRNIEKEQERVLARAAALARQQQILKDIEEGR